jgi:[protein-PII] uridylyltransferase
MIMTLPRIPHQRAIIDRRSLSEAVSRAVAAAGGDPARARPAVLDHLRQALAEGRDELSRRLRGKPSAGYECAQGQAFLVDQLVRVLYDYVIGHVYRASNRTTGERIAILAVGGYGRGEMAPHSDVDIAFVTPIKPTSWCEQVIEAMLYFLWDLGLKVGHSSRSLDETVRQAKSDLTIRTALLEGRYVWGDRELYEECARRFWSEVAAGTERQFVAEKLAERNERHKRLGDSRYVVEPNVKEGKGGLRDLHTLYWIGKYVHKVRDPSELVDVGLLTAAEYRAFHRAENFFWAVRCHLHMITRRAEDRLTFDLQREVASRMAFADRPGKSSVERFMQFFFLQANQVGSLTGVFMAQLDEQFARTKPGLLASLRQRRKRKVGGFPVVADKVSVPSDDFFAEDPVRLIEIFVVADKHGMEIHPEAMRQARRDAGLIDGAVRKDPRANALFLEVLTSRHDPETVLRWMSEAGVFGRFIPDFGRVVAQMQFDMYHHYTVDEHTIRAIGLLARIEKGEEREPHPLASDVVRKVPRAGCSMSPPCSTISPRAARRPFDPGRRSGAQALPASGPLDDGDRAGLVAGALAPADERDRLQARSGRLQDHRRLCRPGAERGTPAPAADPDHRRHSRGGAGHLEFVEAPVAGRSLHPDRGNAASGLQAAWPSRAHRRQEEGRGRPASGARRADRHGRAPVGRRLLDCRARGHHHAQPPADGQRAGRAALGRGAILSQARGHARHRAGR